MADDLTRFVLDLADRASRELMTYFRRLPPGGVGSKEQRHDLITVADRVSEELILNAIRTRYPDHAILAEETGTSGGKETSSYQWIVDPLDGTVNFVHGFPFFSVSIAMLHHGVAEVGVVAAPALGEVFVATRGEGCFLGGERLRVSRTETLADAMLTTGFAYERAETPNSNLPNFSRLIYRTRAIRRPGSAAIDLAYVAAGRFDGFWEAHLSPWDLAAGGLLVQEAGGRVTDFALGETWLHGHNVLATNGRIHEELASWLVFDPSLEPQDGREGTR